MKALTRSQRLLLAGATSLAAATVAVSAIALPVQAANSNGSPSGSVTVSPAEGLWSDGANGKPIVVKSSLKCEPSRGSYPAGSTVLAMTTYVLTQQGKESPSLTKSVEVAVPTDFTSFKDDFLAVGINSLQTKPDGTVDDADQNTFPGYAVDEGQTWGLPDGSPVTNFSTILAPNSSYSVAAVCFYRVSQGFSSSYFFEPDSTGHLQSAWSTVTTGSGTGDQLSWKVTAVAQPTNTGSASPTTSSTPTGSASPSHSTTPSPTGDPSHSASPGATETNVEPLTPTGGTGTALTVDLGKQYTVAVPAGSFAAAELINGEIHSTPLALTETATSADDGSASYSFTVPTELSAGEHTLLLTGSASSKTYSVPLTVLAATNNQPFQPLTNWVSDNVGTPGGMTGLFFLLVLLSAAVVLGWRFFIGRTSPHRKH
ncbi:hypothetical protein [Psychromicrobium lacuslunae]|uniref:Uncharacterized protein n=1 Tax=Psychromicrobium lacuslunae TaxID=1618207 RepID=A0A0D4BZT5_9MICC|nr:hypothetical protein [Psychromicrobium lacuslunae]AJT41606.1 hypothetical protein UM93_08925 [Psychromicrobium lacuslunae]